MAYDDSDDVQPRKKRRGRMPLPSSGVNDPRIPLTSDEPEPYRAEGDIMPKGVYNGPFDWQRGSTNYGMQASQFADKAAPYRSQPQPQPMRERPPYNSPFDYRGQPGRTYGQEAGRLAQRSIDDANRTSSDDYDYYRRGSY